MKALSASTEVKERPIRSTEAATRAQMTMHTVMHPTHTPVDAA